MIDEWKGEGEEQENAAYNTLPNSEVKLNPDLSQPTVVRTSINQ